MVTIELTEEEAIFIQRRLEIALIDAEQSAIQIEMSVSPKFKETINSLILKIARA